MKKKTIALALALTLAVGSMVGGTLAWLKAETGPVTNTFTTSNISITLAETDTNLDGDNDPNTNTYKMIPGYAISKDPKVTVLDGSEDCWLFVKVEETPGFGDYMTYSIDTSVWTQGDGTDIPANVYYRTVLATDETKAFDVIKGNALTVKNDAAVSDLTTENQPKLTFTAYAAQYHKNAEQTFTAAEAWKTNFAN